MPRKLYRNTDEKMIAGVCAGLADHFDTDATLVRVAFVVLAFAAGGAVVGYILLWIFVPKGPPPAA